MKSTKPDLLSATLAELVEGIQLRAGAPVTVVVGEVVDPGDPATALAPGPVAPAAAAVAGKPAAAIAAAASAGGAAADAAGADFVEEPTTFNDPPSRQLADADVTPTGRTSPAPSAAGEEAATATLLATLDGVHFELDKAFPLPSIIDTCADVARAATADPARQLLVVGHTDPTGPADYNLSLSDDRARVIVAYLGDDADAFLAFYDHVEHSRRWGTREDQHMLRALPHGGPPLLTAPPSDVQTPAATAALRAFQAGAGLEPDGIAGPKTRRALIAAYMAAPDTSLAKATSIEALACGKRHLKPSASDEAQRRVEIFLFEGNPAPPASACRESPHPGCTAYDTWVATATALPTGGGATTAAQQPEIASFKVFQAVDAPVDEDLTAAWLLDMDAREAAAGATTTVEQGDWVELSWQVSGNFKAIEIDPIGSVAPFTGDTGAGRYTLQTTAAQPASFPLTLRVTPVAAGQQARAANASVQLQPRSGALGPSAALGIAGAKASAAPTASPGCGQIAWWRSPDTTQLLQRHGQVEHLIIQLDFMSQVARNPRAEFGIPGASKTVPGNPGFADVVALATKQIWEIKPESLDAKAAAEASNYVTFANAACSPGWTVGTGYTPSQSPVISFTGGPVTAELFAQQGSPGAINYFWQIQGKKVPVVDPKLIVALRTAVVGRVFGSMFAMPTVPGMPAAPNDVAPPKWLPPFFDPASLPLELQALAVQLTHDLWEVTRSVFLPEFWSGVLLLEKDTWDQLVGPRLLQQRIGLLQVQIDPQVQLARDALTTILFATAAGLGAAVAGSVIAGVMAGASLAAVETAAAAQATTVGGRFLLAAANALRPVIANLPAAAPALRWATAASSAAFIGFSSGRIAFGLPTASAATPTTTKDLQASIPEYLVVNPDLLGSFAVGQVIKHKNADWVVAGIARN